MNIWFSADWHGFHKNICKGVSDWEDKGQCRDFNTVEEHNETLLKNINDNVKKDDIIWFLGDFTFAGADKVYQFRKQINCKNIHFIYGNHDHHIINNREVPGHIQLDGTPRLRMQDLFLSTQQYFSGKIGGQQMFLCHYSMRVWEHSHHGSWCLYGHSHGTLPDYSFERDGKPSEYPPLGTGLNAFWKKEVKFKTMDIGVDTHPEFRPYHLDEIKAIMANRDVLTVDHHNEKTN